MLSAVLLVPGALSLYELVAPCLFGARPGLGGDNVAGGGEGKGSAAEGQGANASNGSNGQSRYSALVLAVAVG